MGFLDELKRLARPYEDEEEEEMGKGGRVLTVIAIIVAVLLVILLVVIMILNFAPNSGAASALNNKRYYLENSGKMVTGWKIMRCIWRLRMHSAESAGVSGRQN